LDAEFVSHPVSLDILLTEPFEIVEKNRNSLK